MDSDRLPPELRRRLGEEQRNGDRRMAEQLARRRGIPADDLGVQVLAAAFSATIIVALERWVEDDGKSDLLELLDRALESLAAGMQELGSPARQRPPASG